MEGTRVERKGREKVVAWRRVERTGIVVVVLVRELKKGMKEKSECKMGKMRVQI